MNACTLTPATKARIDAEIAMDDNNRSIEVLAKFVDQKLAEGATLASLEWHTEQLYDRRQNRPALARALEAALEAERVETAGPDEVTVNGAHIVNNSLVLPGLTFQSGTLQDFVNELVACCDDILEARRDPEENYLAVIEAFYGARLEDGKCAYTGDPAELTNLLRSVAHYARVDAFYKQPLVIGGREFIAG